MRLNTVYFLFILLIISCDDFQLYENVPVGNEDLLITGLKPARGPLRGDTLIIIGKGFHRVPYQNDVCFAKVTEMQHYVNELGEVTDSLIYVVKEFSAPVRVVDSSPDSLRVIIPDDAVTGQIRITFGVDTVVSPVPFDLISTLKRPLVNSYSPQFGSPGTEIRISVGGLGRSENMVVRFGEKLAEIKSLDFNNGQIVLHVPGIFPGPTDMRVGAVTETEDTLWSAKLNFGILPSLDKVPDIVSSQVASRANSPIAFGKVRSGLTTLSDFSVNTSDFVPYGVAMSKDLSQMYWINFVSNKSSILRGSLSEMDGDKSRREFPAVGLVMKDLVVQNDFIFVGSNSDIRRYKLNANGDVDGAATFLFQPSGGAKVDVVNMKISSDGKTFFWIDAISKSVYKASLSGDKLTAPVVLYKEGLTNPRGLAIDENSGTIYISDVTTTESCVIWKGASAGQNTQPLEEFYANEGFNQFYSFSDLELDLVNGFIYWSTNDVLYRMSTVRPTATPEIVFQFAGPYYFDF